MRHLVALAAVDANVQVKFKFNVVCVIIRLHLFVNTLIGGIALASSPFFNNKICSSP